jgi:hypothetical protein
MRIFRIFLCVSIISSITSAFVLADVKFLDHSELSFHSGQAGLTIHTDSISEIGEFEYVDTNLLALQSISLGGYGNDGSLANTFYTNRLDNLRINISLAKNNSSSEDDSFIYCFSKFRNLANTYIALSNIQ